jgi:predicted NAD-dependent protein-ADP-ribosyltransferase YbiA (DUF1768 family)
MMFHKALTFSDTATAKEILLVSPLRKCKGLGRRITGFKAEALDPIGLSVVEEGNYWKFTNRVGEDR